MIICPKQFDPDMLNTFCVMQVYKLKILEECTSSLALWPQGNFAVFESQFLLEYYTQRAKKMLISKFQKLFK